jgi:hypothetical protein
MKRLILVATAGALILYPAVASAIPVHVHEKVRVQREVVEQELVKGDPLVTEDTVFVTRVEEDVIHVPPVDEDDDGIADAEDDCIGYCPPPEPTYVESDYAAEPSYEAAPEPTYAAPAAGGGYASSSTVQCESGGDYSIDTGNGYYGAYQFDSSTWDAYGDPAYGEASEAPPAAQDAAAAAVPYDAWPNC